MSLINKLVLRVYNKKHKTNQSQPEKIHTSNGLVINSINMMNEKVECCCDSVGTNILSLDDDSLLNIIKFLPRNDKLSLSCAHTRFTTVFQIYATAYIKEITTTDVELLKPSEIRDSFRNFGEHLHALTLQPDFEMSKCRGAFALVKSHCANVKRLNLTGSLHEHYVDYEQLCLLLSNKPQLKTLRLQNLCLMDAYLSTVYQLSQLEHLSIINCQNFNGFSLRNFTRLRKLRLENLPELDFSVMRAALVAMPDLYALSFSKKAAYDANHNFVDVINGLHLNNKKLEILQLDMPFITLVDVSQMPLLKHFSYAVQDSDWQTTIKLAELLVHKKDTLQSLRIKSFWSHQSQIEKQFLLISQFKNLTKLHLPTKPIIEYFDLTIDDIALRHLCALQHLIELKVCGFNSFTEAGLLSLVQSCQKLKWVNIQGSTIDNTFAEELISVINKDGMRPNGCITFLVYGSIMQERYLPEAYKTKEMQRSVKFVFEKISILATYDNLYDSFECDCNFIEMPFFNSDC